MFSKQSSKYCDYSYLSWIVLSKGGTVMFSFSTTMYSIVFRLQKSFLFSQAYFVTRICSELNAHSPFPNKSYSSYLDYFKKKYEFTIKNPELPLLEAPHINLIPNALIPRYMKVITVLCIACCSVYF